MSQTPAVLLHGLLLPPEMWTAVIERLGITRTATPSLSADSFEGLLVQVREACAATAPDEPAVLIGLSMGGILAMHAAARWPDRVRALVVFDAQPWAEQPEAEVQWDEFERHARDGGSAALTSAFAESVFSPAMEPAQRNAWLDRMRAAPDEATRACIRALRERPDAWGLLHSIIAPTRFVFGADDAITPPDIGRRMAERTPNARFVIIERAGHVPPIEQPDRSAGAIQELLREVG